MKKQLLIIIVMFTTGLITNAQILAGTWSFSDKETISGKDYANALPLKVTLTTKADSLIMETVFTVGADKTTSFRHALANSGQPLYITSVNGKKLVKTLKWAADKRSFELTTIYYKNDSPTDIEITRTEVWSLSADGKALSVQKKSIEKPEDSWEVKGVYAKN